LVLAIGWLWGLKEKTFVSRKSDETSKDAQAYNMAGTSAELLLTSSAQIALGILGTLEQDYRSVVSWCSQARSDETIPLESSNHAG
jgi:hypothetical protein